MKSPKSVKSLEELGRVRLSPNFFMRDFLYSEVANFYGIPNIPEYPDLAIENGKRLCEALLEPLFERFGAITVVSGYRSPTLNAECNKRKLNCASNEKNYAGHIWDYPDADGNHGATASIVVHRFADLYEQGTDWREFAWWMHDHLPYHAIDFFPKLAAFNITWRENPERVIHSYVEPKGKLKALPINPAPGKNSAIYPTLA